MKKWYSHVTTYALLVGSIIAACNNVIATRDELLSVLSPKSGDRIAIGDTLHIKWEADTLQIVDVDIKISFDNGSTWMPLLFEGSINATDPQWGDFGWVVPDSYNAPDWWPGPDRESISLRGRRALIKVNRYDPDDVYGIVGPVEIE